MTVRELIVKLGFDMDKAKVKRAEATIGGIKNQMSGLVKMAAGVAGALGLAFGFKEIVEMSDAWKSVEARVGLATKSLTEQKEVLAELYKISNQTRQSYTATADLYSKVARSAKTLKLSQKDVLGLTDTINRALVVGGGSAQANEAAILQLGQALSAGRLQGDELGSLLENAPRLTQVIADGLGVSTGALKQMGAEGELTAKKVAEAIMKQSNVIAYEFEKMPLTMGQALQIAQNKIGKFFSTFEKQTHFFDTLAKGIVVFVNETIWCIDTVVSSLGGWEQAMFLAEAATIALGVALLWLKWDLVTAGIASVSKALWGLLANPATWMFLAIAAAVMVVILALQDLYVWIQGGDSLIGEYLGSWEDFYNRHKALIDGFVNFFKSAWAFIKALFSGDTDEMSKHFEAMFGENLTKIFEHVVEVIKGLWQGVLIVFNFIVEYLKSVWAFFLALFQGDTEGAVEAAKNCFKIFVDFIKEILAWAWDFIKETSASAFQLLLEFLAAILKSVWELIKEAGKAALEFLIQLIFAIVQKMSEKLNEFVQGLKNKFKEATSSIGGFFNVLKDIILGILDTISGGISSKIINVLKDGLGLLNKLGNSEIKPKISPTSVGGGRGGNTSISIQQNINNNGVKNADKIPKLIPQPNWDEATRTLVFK